MLVDTHTHIYLNEFDSNVQEIITTATLNGVATMYMPAIDSTTYAQLLQVEALYPVQCKAMAGLHPCSVQANYKHELAYVAAQLASRKYIAIGEIGLDYHWDTSFAKQQIIAFETQMQWALDYNIPISIHTRNAMQATIELVKPFARKGLQGIFHCFSGSIESAQEIIKMGFYLGIGGVVTYKNAGVAEVIAQLGLSHVVLETDAPYLSPVPYRGKVNQPSYLTHIAHKLAAVTHTSYEQVAAITTSNAIAVLGA